MRIPTDIPLAEYIRGLIKAHKIEQFYFTDDWRELREDVLEYFHNECQECLRKGKITTDELCVHHVNEIKVKPELALNRYYTDEKGIRQYNLVPLCKTCHNLVHEKLKKHWESNPRGKFVNEERWD